MSIIWERYIDLDKQEEQIYELWNIISFTKNN